MIITDGMRSMRAGDNTPAPVEAVEAPVSASAKAEAETPDQGKKTRTRKKSAE